MNTQDCNGGIRDLEQKKKKKEEVYIHCRVVGKKSGNAVSEFTPRSSR